MMGFRRLAEGVSLENRSLYYKLQIIFSLFFLIPAVGFLWFAETHDLLFDVSIVPLCAVLLIFSFFGLYLLRNIIDRIAALSRNAAEIAGVSTPSEGDELSDLQRHVTHIDEGLRKARDGIEERSRQITAMRDLVALSHATDDAGAILRHTLQQCLKQVHGDMGSVMILEDSRREAFIIEATTGPAGPVGKGDRVDFSTSIAKYAVVNRMPLVVRDIEQDGRFGRKNRERYGTKSFICMPIMTMTGAVGVMTVSRSQDDGVFSTEDGETLMPLVDTAAVMYENRGLLKGDEGERRYLKALERASGIVTGNPDEDVSVRAIIDEIRRSFGMDMIAIAITDRGRPGSVVVHDCVSSGETGMAPGTAYEREDSMVRRVTDSRSSCIVEDCDGLSDELVRGCRSCLFVPFRYTGDAGGVLVVAAEHASRLTEVQAHMEITAQIISCAMERNRLHSVVAKRSRDMDTLRRIGHVVSLSSFDVQKVISHTMDMVSMTLDVEGGLFYLLERETLVVQSSFLREGEGLEPFAIAVGEGIAGSVAQRGMPALVNDLTQSPPYLKRVSESMGRDVRSLLCVPVIASRKVTAVIEIINKRSGVFDGSDEELLLSIADAAGSAMGNAHLYGETERRLAYERDMRHLFQKYAPPEVVDSATHRAETDMTQFHRRERLTIVGVELIGLDALVEQMGVEESMQVLNGFFSHMGNIVLKHFGTMDTYVGDGFLALFGAPRLQTAGADHAVRAALEMKEGFAEINSDHMRARGLSVDMGITITTGEVIVGTIGFDRKMEYRAVGRAASLPLRLSPFCRNFPNSILMTEETLAAAQSLLNVRALNVKELDPFLGDVAIYELLGVMKESVEMM